MKDLKKVTNETNDIEAIDKTPEADIEKAPRGARRGRHAPKGESVVSESTDDEPEPLRPILGMFDFEVEIKFAGRKSSEGDGVTAADIERLLARTGE